MLRAIQEQVDEIFDKADHPNVAHPDDYDYDELLKLGGLPVPEKQTIKILKDIMEGIVYISSHLLIYKPCQVFKEHIIKKHSNWGIRNLICYRDPNENPDFSPLRYWPIDYEFHPDEDSELMWSIGRLWFQLLTDSQLPPIKSMNQKYLDQTIDNSGIKDLTIIPLLKLILQIDPQKRMNLQQIMTHMFFQFSQNSMLDIRSVLPANSYTSSKFIQSNFTKAGEYTIKQSGYNPFKQELFKRDFKEAIVIADLFQKVKNWIFDNFEVQENKNEIDFSCYLIELMSYIKLKNFQVERDKNMYDLVILSDKPDYTKFMEKIIFLEKKLNKRRKIKKFDEFKQKMPQCLCALEDVSQDLVEKQFKGYLSTYAHHLQEKRIKNHQNSNSYLKNYTIMILMLLVRCSKYIFSNCRSYLFEDFIDPSGFDLRSVINNIDNCKDAQKLQRIDKKIQQLYFRQ